MTHRLQVAVVSTVGVGAALIGSWHITTFVWARDTPLVPFDLISIAPDWLAGALFMAPVAVGTAVFVALVSTAAWKLTGTRSTARAAVAGLASGACCGLGLILVVYLPHPFYDSIPGYSRRSWAVIVGGSAAGIAAGARIASETGHKSAQRGGSSNRQISG